MTNKNKINWNFDHSYASLPTFFYTKTTPTPANNPRIVLLNKEVANDLGLHIDALHSESGIDQLAGNKLPEGGSNIAQAYAGHQFGHFTKLGDGRAIMLGEHITPQGKRVDIQLKGSGKTAYSRGGDGLAALGPMLREYIISEGMHGLGIPTTRSLAVVQSDDPVYREQVLDRGILTRVAQSHIRVGTFQYAVAFGNKNDLQTLADYTIDRHYPYLKMASSPYLALLREVTEKQAALIAKWQLVGFIHGVMNTDNMTISGETIDYGPCAFMNKFDTNTVFSSIDVQGRYKYGNQPAIANWNLARFAECLLPLIDQNEDIAMHEAKEVIATFQTRFYAYWLDGMRAKLGLFNRDNRDESLCADLLSSMQKYHADYTNTFLALTHGELIENALFMSVEFKSWHLQWEERKSQQNKSEKEIEHLMRTSNPAIIPRNHLVENAIASAVEQHDYHDMTQLLDALKNPFDHTSKQADYADIPIPPGSYQTFCGT